MREFKSAKLFMMDLLKYSNGFCAIDPKCKNKVHCFLRGVRKYQRGNQNPYIEEEQTTQWPKENKQRSTKHTYKSNDRAPRTPPKPGGELRYSGRVSSSCSTSGTRQVNLVANPVILINTNTLRSTYHGQYLRYASCKRSTHYNVDVLIANVNGNAIDI
jgi:hypothetical protein